MIITNKSILCTKNFLSALNHYELIRSGIVSSQSEYSCEGAGLRLSDKGEVWSSLSKGATPGGKLRWSVIAKV